MGFEEFPERCDRGPISKKWGIVLNRFMNSTIKSGGMKELEFSCTTPSICEGSIG